MFDGVKVYKCNSNSVLNENSMACHFVIGSDSLKIVSVLG